MPDIASREPDDEVDAWLYSLINDATVALGKSGLFDDPLLDIKPAWILPKKILIGKVRAHGNPVGFRWFICGDTRLDHVGDDVAGTPREAARHFSLKWQLDASRLAGDQRHALTRQAELLYGLVADDRLWVPAGTMD